MPQYSHEPPPERQRHSFRLIRTPAGKPYRGFVISERLIGCPTHYVANRTVPCEPENCEPCQSGLAWRWHGYLLVTDERTSEVVIFEMTAAASDEFTKYYKRFGTLRGCHFQAERLNGKPNGRVLIQCKPADLAKIQLPKELDLRKLLAHIWNIAPNQVIRPESDHRPPAETIQIDRARPEIVPYQPTYEELTNRPTVEQTKSGNGRAPVQNPDQT